MKGYLIASVFLFSTLLCVAQHTNLREMSLRGKVKSLQELRYKAVKNIAEIQKAELISRHLFIFDSAGNLIEHSQYSNSKPDKNTISDFGENATRVDPTRYNTSGNQPSDENENRRHRSSYPTARRNNDVYNTYYALYNDGKNPDGTPYKPNGSISEKYMAIYNDDKYPDGTPYQPNKSKQDKYNSIFYGEDKNGEDIIDESSFRYNQICRYNADGKAEEILFFGSEPGYDYSIRYAYNRNELVSEAKYNAPGELTEIIWYDYLHDQLGNWVQLNTYIQNGNDNPEEPESITERKITYYE